MFDDDDDDQGFFLLVLGVLAAILLIVTVVARSGDDLPAATVTGDAPAETTTAAPTTTTAAPTTTTAAAAVTEAPATTVAAPFTMWEALVASGEAPQFVGIGGALGLRADLETLETEDGEPVNRTLFAPSDGAVSALDPAALGALAADPDAAAALVGYHFLEGEFTAEDLVALDGQVVQTRTGLPMSINVVDGDIVLNNSSVVTSTDFDADNGIVHIIDTILTPPTVNEVIGLENIEFEVGSAIITENGQAELQKAIDFFAANAGVRAVIEGHTDTDGADDLNLALSQSRADAVRQFLIDNEIDGDRLTAVGFGETRPLLVDGVEDKAASRRIEFQAR